MPDWGQYILRDSYFSIAQAQIDGYSLVHVTGYNPDVVSGADQAVSAAACLYPWSVWDPSRLVTVVTTSALGTGSVVVSGLVVI